MIVPGCANLLLGWQTDNSESNDTGNDTGYLTFTSTAPFSIAKYSSDASYGWDGTLEYSVDDGNTWTAWPLASSTTPIQSGANDTILFRGTGNTRICGNSISSRWSITPSGSNKVAASGNIETLLDYTVVKNGGHPAMATYCYYGMFQDCTSLTTPPKLPETTLKSY